MTTQTDKANAFRALHIPGDPLVLYNIWDVGSAKAVAAAGAKALATGSWSVAASLGFADGEATPLDLVLANLARIAAACELPVSLDFESGYGGDPAGVERSVARAIEAGAIGFNLEDSTPGHKALRGVAEQADRIAAARAAAKAAGVPVFINARTDVFLMTEQDTHGDDLVEAALERARAYADAGADGLFAPVLLKENLISALCAASPLPVNIMALAAAPSNARLAELGVARISYGPIPYRQMLAALEAAARGVMG